MLNAKKLCSFTSALLLGGMILCTSVQAESTFTDVSPNYWAYESIKQLNEKGIIGGLPDGSFGIEKPVTRAQSAVFIGRTLQLNTSNIQNPNFIDVSPKTSGYEYIAALVEKGVFAEAKHFNPHESLTRAQMAKILVEAFDLDGNSNKVFQDVSPSHWAYDYVNKLVASGITSGTSNTTFSPNDPVTRSQMAVFISRVLDYQQNGNVSAQPKEDKKENKEFDSNFVNRQLMEDALKGINEIRKKEGLHELIRDPKVEEAAIIREKEMAETDIIAHVTPIEGHYAETLDKVGAKYIGSGENITVFHPQAEGAINAWMESPGHRDNILGAHYTHTGIAVTKGDNTTEFTYRFLR